MLSTLGNTWGDNTVRGKTDPEKGIHCCRPVYPVVNLCKTCWREVLGWVGVGCSTQLFTPVPLGLLCLCFPTLEEVCLPLPILPLTFTAAERKEHATQGRINLCFCLTYKVREADHEGYKYHLGILKRSHACVTLKYYGYSSFKRDVFNSGSQVSKY